MFQQTPMYVNTLQISTNQDSNEVHLRFLAVTPKLKIDMTKESEVELFEVVNVFLTESALRKFYNDIGETLKNLKSPKEK